MYNQIEGAVCSYDSEGCTWNVKTKKDGIAILFHRTINNMTTIYINFYNDRKLIFSHFSYVIFFKFIRPLYIVCTYRKIPYVYKMKGIGEYNITNINKVLDIMGKKNVCKLNAGFHNGKLHQVSL